MPILPPPKVVEKVWGREVWYVNSDLYCCKKLEIKPGYRCSFHMHPKKDETFTVVYGVVEVEWVPADAKDCQSVIGRLFPGYSFHVPAGTYHRFWCGTLPACMIETSTTHDDADVVRLEESGPLPSPPQQS